MMFRFAYPMLLILLPGAAGWLVFNLRRKPACITYSMTAHMAAFAGAGSAVWSRIPLMLRTACLILLVLTAARPQLYNVSRDIRSLSFRTATFFISLETLMFIMWGSQAIKHDVII